MARAARRAKTWVWYLAGCLCALVWGRSAEAGTPPEPPPPPYGVRAVHPDVEKNRKKAEKLVDEYLAPVPAKAPGEKAGKEIKRLVADFGAENHGKREAASRAVVKHGAAALAELRLAAHGKPLKSAEVAQRAGLAIAAIEAAARKALVARLKALGPAARQVVLYRHTRAQRTLKKEQGVVQEAKKAGKTEVVKTETAKKAEALLRAARERFVALSRLVRVLVPRRDSLPPPYGSPPPPPRKIGD